MAQQQQHQRSHSAYGAGGGGGGGAGQGDRDKTYFEQQREAFVGDIAMSFEHVLANMNKLNRSLEAVIAVGNEFSSVEALWSQFENVMAKEEPPQQQQQGGQQGGGGGGGQQQQQQGRERMKGEMKEEDDVDR